MSTKAPMSTTFTYKSEKAMRNGIIDMNKKGWAVGSTTAYTPKKSLARWIMGGLIFFNPKPRFIVTFVWPSYN